MLYISTILCLTLFLSVANTILCFEQTAESLNWLQDCGTTCPTIPNFMMESCGSSSSTTFAPNFEDSRGDMQHQSVSMLSQMLGSGVNGGSMPWSSDMQMSCQPLTMPQYQQDTMIYAPNQQDTITYVRNQDGVAPHAPPQLHLQYYQYQIPQAHHMNYMTLPVMHTGGMMLPPFDAVLNDGSLNEYALIPGPVATSSSLSSSSTVADRQEAGRGFDDVIHNPGAANTLSAPLTQMPLSFSASLLTPLTSLQSIDSAAGFAPQV